MEKLKKVAEDAPRPGLPPSLRPHPHPPSAANFREVLARAAEMGRIQFSNHFSEQCSERGFSTLDVETLVETGNMIDGPSYDPTHHSFKCEIHGSVDGRWWKLILALDCDSDFCNAPRVVAVTVHRRERNRR